jgi:hypothetical protein
LSCPRLSSALFGSFSELLPELNLLDPVIDLLMHWVIHGFIDSSFHRFIHSFIHWFVHSFNRWLIYRLIPWKLQGGFDLLWKLPHISLPADALRWSVPPLGYVRWVVVYWSDDCLIIITGGAHGHLQVTGRLQALECMPRFLVIEILCRLSTKVP